MHSIIALIPLRLHSSLLSEFEHQEHFLKAGDITLIMES